MTSLTTSLRTSYGLAAASCWPLLHCWMRLDDIFPPPRGMRTDTDPRFQITVPGISTTARRLGESQWRKEKAQTFVDPGRCEAAGIKQGRWACGCPTGQISLRLHVATLPSSTHLSNVFRKASALCSAVASITSQDRPLITQSSLVASRFQTTLKRFLV